MWHSFHYQRCLQFLRKVSIRSSLCLLLLLRPHRMLGIRSSLCQPFLLNHHHTINTQTNLYLRITNILNLHKQHMSFFRLHHRVHNLFGRLHHKVNNPSYRLHRRSDMCPRHHLLHKLYLRFAHLHRTPSNLSYRLHHKSGMCRYHYILYNLYHRFAQCRCKLGKLLFHPHHRFGMPLCRCISDKWFRWSAHSHKISSPLQRFVQYLHMQGMKQSQAARPRHILHNLWAGACAYKWGT